MHDYQIGIYSDTYRDYHLSAPKRFNWAYEVFDNWGEDSSKIAMLWVSQSGDAKKVTFRDMSERSRRVANALTGLGAKKGDRVFTLLPRVVEWWEVMIGCIRAGLVTVPGTTMLTSRDIEYRLNIAEVNLVVTDSENVDKLDLIRDACPSLKEVIVIGSDEINERNVQYEDLIRSASDILPNPCNLSTDPMMIYFTSGTTGYPKMVLNTHASYPVGHDITGRFWLDNRPEDIHWTLADTGWAQAAWTSFFAPWNMGAALFIWDHRGKFDAKTTLGMFERYPITTFFAPPTAYRMMVQEDLHYFRPLALRHCVGAGEAVNPEVIDAWREGTGLHIWEGYGQTETVLCAATFPGMEYRPGSLGVAAPGFTLAIVDENGNEIDNYQEGEIAIKTSPDRPIGLFPGYWRNEEANAKSFRGDWYHTGDRAYRDDDGYYWFVGRSDDLINSASYRIGPFEVESALIEHEAVAEAAVIGKSDEMRGQIVKAFVVLADGYIASRSLSKELENHVAEVTAPYKKPREVEFVSDLPKTISGKIRRNELRRMEITSDNL